MVCDDEIAIEFGVVGVITMGFPKHLLIESKAFSLSREGSFLLVIERSWKVMSKVRLGLSMMQWLAKAL